jgi:hypothetical protein
MLSKGIGLSRPPDNCRICLPDRAVRSQPVPAKCKNIQKIKTLSKTPGMKFAIVKAGESYEQTSVYGYQDPYREG